MARVEMTGIEYFTLVEKEKELNQLKKALINATEVRIDEEIHRPLAYFTFEYPEDLKQEILEQVVDKLMQDEKSVRYLYNENSPILKITGGYFTYDWGTANDPNTIDLRLDLRIKTLWDKFDAEKEEQNDDAE